MIKFSHQVFLQEAEVDALPVPVAGDVVAVVIHGAFVNRQKSKQNDLFLR